VEHLPIETTLALSPEHFKTIWLMTLDLASRVPPAAIVYVIAAMVIRVLGERRAWCLYLGLAAAVLLGFH
jgi:hypothetical protein